MNIFCSGIGGIGLSAYASHMRCRGHDVSGSDRSDSALIDDLRSQGIGIATKQVGSNIAADTDLLVYSQAVPEDSEERAEARRRGIRQISYFQALGELTDGARLIAVCGTHGKSSTTAMAIGVLQDAGLDPNAIVGTKLPSLAGRNWRRGSSDLWIVEACEYRKSFLFLRPTTVMLTNADGDHFDAFTNLSDYHKAFVEFLSNLPNDGTVIAHGQDSQSVEIVAASGRALIDADQEELPRLSVPGFHMQKNAQLVAALGRHLGLDAAAVSQSLKNYAGSWRRMEVKKTKGDITVIDDYAHHPTEIRATLAAMKSAYPGRRIVAVFQPHTHDRTHKLWKEFASAFKDADHLVLLPVYDARPEHDAAKADLATFALAIEEGSGKSVLALPLKDNAERVIRSRIKSGDVVVMMGAGDITDTADSLATSLS